MSDGGGPTTRVIQPSSASAGEEFMSNYVSTTKYTLLNFPAKAMWLQFQRLANVYFLVIAVLQSIEEISPLHPFTAIAPLVFVVALSMLKEGIEDRQRYLRDKEVNGKACLALRPTSSGASEFVSIKWEEVRVGDLVQIVDKQFFPADLVLLASSAAEGSCYIDTCNLDGETNLKTRQAHDGTASLVEQADSMRFWKGATLQCGPPDEHLYKFKGTVSFEGRDHALDETQLLLRGSQLKNTQWVHGLVVYTGHESKIMNNAKDAVNKISNVERKMNRIIVFIFLAQCVLCIYCAAASSAWVDDNGDIAWYLQTWEYFSGSASTIGVITYLTYMVLLNTMIPISLMVSIEVIKLVQAAFMNWDEEMAHEGNHADARTSTLNEELGQIKYIFSDKTGTLTENRMEFMKCSVDGNAYGKPPAAGETAGPGKGTELQHVSAAPLAQLQQAAQVYGSHADLFLTLLSVCHTVVLETEDDGTTSYNADSPDEAALVGAAASMGYEFLGTQSHQTTVRVGAAGETRVYEILHVLAFNSTRKRMSVVCRRVDNGEGTVMVFCKGADNVILQRCLAEEPLRGQTVEHLRAFAAEGLRTLCVGFRVLAPAEYASWSQRYHDAEVSMGDREAAMDALMEEVERDLHLVGATAIEDKLQQGVPETIARLATAGIALWVLTGDKQETAIEIGKSCQLLLPGMEQFVLNAATEAEFDATVGEFSRAAAQHQGAGSGGCAVIIDGATLTFALAGAPRRRAFYELASQCQSVIVCRSSPLQKALVVELVKEHDEGSITLAIGDGANDVSMIRAAHVGIGVSGQEGQQAVRSSDYAITQFRHLERLLLHHGRLSYIRISQTITTFFHKNLVFTLPLFWFSTLSAASGQSAYSDALIAVYNMILTALPPLAIGLFQENVSPQLAARFPQLYGAGQCNRYFSISAIAYDFACGFWQSVVMLYVPFAVFDGEFAQSDGKDLGFHVAGLASYMCVVVMVLLRYCLRTTHFTAFNALFYGFSFFLLFVFVLGLDTIEGDLYGVASVTFAQPAFWYCVPLTSAICLLPEVMLNGYVENLAPAHKVDPVHVIRRMPVVSGYGGGDGQV